MALSFILLDQFRLLVHRQVGIEHWQKAMTQLGVDGTTRVGLNF
jgi:hypothetical protein